MYSYLHLYFIPKPHYFLALYFSMEYLVVAILIILLIKFLIKNKHIFFIEDNSETENHHLAIKSNDSTFDYKITPDNFYLRPSLLFPNERSFFEQLKLAVGNQYDIYPQVSLISIFQPTKKWRNRAEISKLNKTIDFVLFDKNTQTPKIAIELDGYSHSNPKSFNRDQFVGQLFQKFNIPLVRFNNGNYSAQDIKNKLPTL